MYRISDHGIKKHIENQWYMIVWGDMTQLTAYNKEEADNMYNTTTAVSKQSFVVYNPDGTIYRATRTEQIPGWDPTLRWGVKTPKEADKLLERRNTHEKARKPLFKLF